MRAHVWLELARASAATYAARPVFAGTRVLGDAAFVLAETVGTVVLLDRFHGIAGWSTPQVIVLLALGQVTLSLALTFSSGLEGRRFSELVRRGRFDQVLIQPVPILVWLLLSDFRPFRLGRAAASVCVLAWAASRAGVSLTMEHVAVSALAVASGTVVMLSAVVLGAALTFITVEGTEVSAVLSFGGVNLAAYPVEIYSSVLRAVFLYAVPIALCVYVPALDLVGRSGPAGAPAALLPVVPLAAALFAGVAAVGWRAGVHRYMSVGS